MDVLWRIVPLSFKTQCIHIRMKMITFGRKNSSITWSGYETGTAHLIKHGNYCTLANYHADSFIANEVFTKWGVFCKKSQHFTLNHAVVITHHGWKSSQKPEVLYTWATLALQEQLVHVSQPRDQTVRRRLALVEISPLATNYRCSMGS